jgi:hypothetical protein
LSTQSGGKAQKSTEDLGKSLQQTLRHFQGIDPLEHGKCALERLLCARQNENREAIVSAKKSGQVGGSGIYGTKWKPYLESFAHPKSQESLEWLASQPHIKVIFNQRNLLDVYLSQYKHQSTTGVPAHCHEGNVECLQKHLEAERSLIVPTDSLLQQLEHWEHAAAQTLALLESSHVDVAHVQYESLFYSETANEWIKALLHLEVPAALYEKLDMDRVRASMDHVATSSASHAEKMSNYEAVKAALMDTQFAKYLQE